MLLLLVAAWDTHFCWGWLDGRLLLAVVGRRDLLF